jgi:hypothetical protein
VDADLVAEALELVDEPADVGLVGLALKEVVAAELGVGLAPVQDVVGADQDGVPDRDRGSFVVAASAKAPVLGRQVGIPLTLL